MTGDNDPFMAFTPEELMTAKDVLDRLVAAHRLYDGYIKVDLVHADGTDLTEEEQDQFILDWTRKEMRMDGEL